MQTKEEIKKAVERALVSAGLPSSFDPEIPALAVRIWREQLKKEREPFPTEGEI